MKGQPLVGFDDLGKREIGYLIVQVFTGHRKKVYVLKGPAEGKRLKTEFQMKKSPGKWLRVALNLADGKWSAKVTQARCKFAVVGHGWDPDCEKTREQISALEKTSTKATIDLLDGKQRPVAMGELQYNVQISEQRST